MIDKNKIFRTNLHRPFFVVAFIVCLLAIYVLNVLYPVYADDWVYTLFYELEPYRRMTGLKDLVVSQYNHYMLWGGRTVAHTIAQLLLALPIWLHDILNTLAFGVYLLFLYKISNILNQKSNSIIFLFVACLLWIFSDSMIFSSAIWITGSANYLWTSVIIVLFIYPFVRYMTSNLDSSRHNSWKTIVLSIGGLMAGWTNENSTLSLLFFLLIFFFVCKKQRKVIPVWSIVAAITCLIGSLLLLLAPGNFVRLEGEATTVANSFWEMWTYRILNLFSTLKITHTFTLSVFYLVCLAIFIILNREWKKHNEKKSRVFLSLLMVAIAYVAAVTMIAAPMIAYRTLFFTNSMLIVAIAIIVIDLYNTNRLLKLGVISFTICLFTFSSYDYYKKYTTLHFISEIWKERDAYMESEKKNGNCDIVFKTTFTAHPKYLLNEMKPDVNDSRNKFYSIYKGVSSIRSDSSAVSLPTP